MAQWLDQFENHTVHETLNSIENILSNTEKIVDEIENADASEYLSRLILIIKLVREKFDTTDPFLFTGGTLNQINSSLQQIINEINAFNSNSNPGHLTNASNHSDAILDRLSFVVSLNTPGSIEGVKDSVISFRRSAGQYFKNIETEYENLHTKFNEQNQNIVNLTSEINNQKGRLDNAITQFQQQFSDAENARRAQFEKSKDKRKDQYDAVITSFKEKFESELKLFGEDYEKFKAQVENFLETANENAILDQSKLAEDAENLLTEIENQKNKAAELVTIITNSGMVGGYQKVANRAKWTSRIWHGATILSLIGLIVFAIFAFKETTGDAIQWGKFGARTFVAIAFGILAAYSAKQADKNGQTEMKNRKMELELAAIDPYLAELPVETQHKIKEKLASRLFAQNDYQEDLPNSQTSGSVVDLLRMSLDAINALSKKQG